MGAATGVDAKEKDAARALPDSKTLRDAGELLIKDEKGNEIPLHSLYSNNGEHKTLLVFIRHFFCGFCEEYVRALAKDLPPSTLSGASTTLILIGCGDPVCIPDYKKRTNCPYDIYADPSRKVYDKLGMVSSLSGGKRPDYVSRSMFGVVLSSAWTAISRPSHTLKAGPTSQNGGEWLFQNGELKWCHRMMNTANHAEVQELKDILGIQ